MGVERAAYDDVADAYHETFDVAGMHDPAFDVLVGSVSGQRVLSLDCGQGREARLLADLGATVSGVDVSAAQLDFARRQESAAPRGIRYVQGDARDQSGV